jgi:CheY-like chemotaxis protein
MDGHGKTILVVDDNESNRKLLALLLDNAHYDVHLAADGCEAVDAMLKGVFDAVVTDWDMPRLNGSEFIALSRILWPDTPVIIVSAHAVHPGDGVHRQAFAWIQKPYEPQELLQVLHTAVHTFAQRRSERSITIPSHG